MDILKYAVIQWISVGNPFHEYNYANKQEWQLNGDSSDNFLRKTKGRKLRAKLVSDSHGVQLELTAFFQTREQLAIQIATAGDSIRKVTKNFYQVRSQSGKGWYKVKKLQDVDVWTCECADFMYRLNKDSEKVCKHILAVKSLQRTQLFEKKIEAPPPKPILCPKCSYSEYVKHGYRMLKDGSKRQRYTCVKCKHRYIVREPGFTKISATPQIVSEALNLIFSGLSFRKAATHLSMVHQEAISYGTILYWFKKYVMIMTEYVDTIFPEYHEVWSVDEMMVNVKDTKPTGIGRYDWMWSIINPQTKFVVSSVISKKRESADAEVLFQRGKKRQESDPRYIITDALHAYEPAFKQAFDQKRIAHIRTKSLSDGFANRPVERWHNEVRENIKTRRGLGNDKSTEIWADALRLNHNFIRPHSGLPNKITPAEASDVNLGLGQNKVKDLIVKSAEAQQRKREYNIEVQLGKRLKYVTINRDKDSISVKAENWIPKSIWREINDILFINGFSWLENGRDSRWIKMSRQTPVSNNATI